MKFFIDIPNFGVIFRVFGFFYGNSFSQRSQKNHHRIELFKTFSTIYNMSYLLNFFSLTYQFWGFFLGFFGCSRVRFQFMFLKISSLNSIFQDLFNNILYSSVAQKFIDFVSSHVQRFSVNHSIWEIVKSGFYWVLCFKYN